MTGSCGTRNAPTIFPIVDLPLQCRCKYRFPVLHITQTRQIGPHVAIRRELLPKTHGQHAVHPVSLKAFHVERQDHCALGISQRQALEELLRALFKPMFSAAIDTQLMQHTLHAVAAHDCCPTKSVTSRRKSSRRSVCTQWPHLAN